MSDRTARRCSAACRGTSPSSAWWVSFWPASWRTIAGAALLSSQAVTVAGRAAAISAW